jgi:Tfp pilus assembly protein PilF
MMLRGRIAVASAWLLLSTPLGAAAQRTQAVDGRLRDARAQLKSGHLDPAQPAVESVLERTPQSVAALLLGEILEARKDLKGAVGAYEQAIAVSPRDAGAYDKLGFALGRLDCVT